MTDALHELKVRELFGAPMHPVGVDTTVSDAELTALALSGDAAALAALLEKSRPWLYATAISFLGNRADALDAVQETFIVALLRLSEVRDHRAVRAWLNAVLRNLCFTHIRRRREIPRGEIEWPDVVPGPEDVLEEHVMREWVWRAVGRLNPEERVTVLLRHFSRCTSYEAIAQVTAVPVGTVRSRLNRARTRLADDLMRTVVSTPLDHADEVAARREQWEAFYSVLQEHPEPRTYQDLYVPEVEVSDPGGRWHGIDAWSGEEREAISIGVRATIVGILTSTDITVVEVDFTNPDKWPDHCPPQATFVHHLVDGRSSRLRIYYPGQHLRLDPSEPS